MCFRACGIPKAEPDRTDHDRAIASRRLLQRDLALVACSRICMGVCPGVQFSSVGAASYGLDSLVLVSPCTFLQTKQLVPTPADIVAGGTFDVKGVECLNEFDRKYIHAAIVEPFLREVRVPVLPPLGSMLLLTTAMISASLDYVVGLLKAGAPTQSIMAYIVAIMVFSFGLPATALFLLFACERMPEPPAFRGSQYLQSLFLLFGLCLTIVVGLVCGPGSYALSRSCWSILAWMCFALVYAGVAWRFCGLQSLERRQ